MLPEMGAPVRIGAATDTWTDVAAGMVPHLRAVKENGILWCWGETADGQLGDGETSPNGQEIEQIGTATMYTGSQSTKENSRERET
ncbi:MAG: hypothetical protein QG671_1054 [Actinomycetota bacterium]|nr:hypothetical protein [Actinomycetota bacterium]